MANTASGFSFNSEILNRALKRIYSDTFNPATEIEENLFQEFSRSLNLAADKGISKAPHPDEDFIDALRHNNAVFAAFKTHRLQTDVAARLLDSNGNLKPFEQWKNDVKEITSHQCGAWLRTEYDTAVLRARQAANWQQFLRERDVLPNLEWIPSTSPNPGTDHQPFWNTVLPIEHPFWDRHRPGDRWNCKCDLRSTDKPATVVPANNASGNDPQPGLSENPGKKAAVFSDNHPYFPANCDNCPFYKSGIRTQRNLNFSSRIKDCYNCPFIDGCIENIREYIHSGIKPPAVETYDKVPEKDVYISPYHGADESKENKRIATFLYEKLGEPIYLLPRIDSNSSTDILKRKQLLPEGAFDKKNPDFLLWNKLFDAKSMLSVEYDGNWNKSKRKIENRFKSAKDQAENFVIEINDSFPRDLIHQTTTNYLNITNTKRIIMIIWRNKLFVYNNYK